MGPVFISYSRKDLSSVRTLYKNLDDTGYSAWLDEEELVAGQDWELEINKAMRTAAAIIVCLSSSWTNDRGYVQKELKMALETSRQVPEGQIFLIPVKLDKCDAPPSLEKLHWINLFEPTGFEKLRKALDRLSNSDPKIQTADHVQETDAWSSFLEDTIAAGGLLYDDAWTYGSSAEEVEFKKLLKGRWESGMDLLEAGDYASVVEFWEPLLDNPYFQVAHDEWRDRPYFRCQIHSAKSQLFMSYANLGQVGHFEIYVPKAFKTLKEVLLGNAYSLKGASHDRLSTDGALTQNLNYLQTLNFALEWFRGWSPQTLWIIANVNEREAKDAKAKVSRRIAEIEFLLEQHSKRTGKPIDY